MGWLFGKEKLSWQERGDYFYPVSEYFKTTFGGSVRKVSVDAGFSCPNIDGTLGRTGCIFCNNRSFSPSRRLGGCHEIQDQVETGISRLHLRFHGEKYIAYFQPATNTYAPVERLEVVYRAALRHPQVVGLAIGTRPDSVPDDVLDLIARLSEETWVILEIGLQTTNDSSLRFLHRGHDYAAFLESYERIVKRNIRLGVHLILGIPGEDQGDILRTANEVAAKKIESVKLHNLYVVKNTILAEMFAKEKIELPSVSEYAAMVVDFLELQKPTTVVDRLAGDAPPEFLIAPEWSSRKYTVREAIRQEFLRRHSRQGKKYRGKG